MFCRSPSSGVGACVPPPPPTPPPPSPAAVLNVSRSLSSLSSRLSVIDRSRGARTSTPVMQRHVRIACAWRGVCAHPVARWHPLRHVMTRPQRTPTVPAHARAESESNLTCGGAAPYWGVSSPLRRRSPRRAPAGVNQPSVNDSATAAPPRGTCHERHEMQVPGGRHVTGCEHVPTRRAGTPPPPIHLAGAGAGGGGGSSE